MLEHQQSHTDNYRFRCSICNKGFTRQSYYRDHKCPTVGDRTGAEENEEADEAAGASAVEEQEGERNGRRSRFTRISKRLQTDGEEAEEEDGSDGDQETAETQPGDEKGTDGCHHAAMATTEGQAERGAEEHGGMETSDELQTQTGTNAHNSSQRQPCL